MKKNKIAITYKADLLFLLKLFLLSSFFSFLFEHVYKFFKIELIIPDAGLGKATMLVLELFVAPVIETLIYQALLYWIVFYFFRKTSIKTRSIIYLGVTTFLFAISHNYSIWYIIAVTISGFILTYVYLHFKIKYQNFIMPFAYTVLFHFTNNLLAHFF